MQAPPDNLTRVFGDVDRSEINTWWLSLSDDARDEVARLCDERLDRCFFGIVADDRDHIVPKVNGGKFVPGDDAWGYDEWGPSYFEHLLEHPELVLIFDPTQRTFHTGCIRHADARACWQDGAVPQGFECPFTSAACLMTPLKGRRIYWRYASSC